MRGRLIILMHHPLTSLLAVLLASASILGACDEPPDVPGSGRW